MAIRTTWRTPVALGMYTPPMRDRDFSCSRRNEREPFLTRVNRGVKRILCHRSNSNWLILDSRVVMGQFWRNKLFLQAFHGGRDRGGIFEKSLLISSV